MRSMRKWFVLLICTALLVCLAVTWAAADGSRIYGYNPATGMYEYMYYDEKGKQVTDGWITVDGKKYYLKDGEAITGWQKIDGYQYYFNNSACIGANSIYDQATERYYYYYFDSEGRMQKSCWIKENNQLYYYSADGKRAENGWLTIGKDKYYIKPYGYAATGSFQIQQENTSDYDYYYADANGKIQTGWITIDEQLYYYGSDGKRLSGLQEIDGATYYLNPAVSYGRAYIPNPDTGSSDTYYFDPKTGKMQTGFVKIEESDYQGGTVTRIYYFTASGKMFTDNWLLLGEDYYYLTPSLQTGLVSVYDNVEQKSYKYYFAEDGKMQTGLRKISDTDYSGAAVTRNYYFGPDGRAVSGWQQVGSSWYYFSTYGNTALTGIQYIGDSYYCFNDEGVMQTGWNDGGESRGWCLFGDDGKMVESFAGMSSVTIPAKVKKLRSSYFKGIDRDFVICCEEGSYAESFALHNGFQYNNGKKEVVGYQITNENEKVKWVVANYTTSEMSDLEKVRALHDWLIHNAHYDTTYSVHAASGVLLNGSGVCDSYAKAYGLLLDAVGIDNRFVSGYAVNSAGNGGSHAWNLVKLGENWYHVDCTWDDPTNLNRDDPIVSGNEGYNYFLISDATIGRNHTWSSSVQALSDMVWRGEAGWQQIEGIWYYFDTDGILVTGHARIDGVLYGFTGDGQLMTAGWQSLGSQYYYATANGTLLENEWVSDGGWYYLGTDGVMATGWQEIGGEWYYFSESGAMATGWIFDGSDWYFLGADGTISTGWVSDGGSWYYMSSGGKMLTGWLEDSGTWYYFTDSGLMKTGWAAIGGDWYYFSGSGAMQTGWVQDGAWYYLASSGRMQTGWQEIDGSWYYLKSDGKMASGWLQLGSTWYYLAGGKMVTGWQEIGGQWEMFSDSGAWLYTWQGN